MNKYQELNEIIQAAILSLKRGEITQQDVNKIVEYVVKEKEKYEESLVDTKMMKFIKDLLN
jgi:hypothetical protein